MDRIEAMRVFVQVADMNGYTRAAERLRLPKATVSAAVRQIEEEVGARLLHRTTRVVRLTEDGRLFYERCRALLADFDDVEGLFKKSTADLVGRVRVDMSTRLARTFFIPRLPRFLAAHPHLDVELTASDRHVDLVREGVDLVVRGGALGDSSLAVRSLGELPIINLASPAYLARHGTPATVDDLDAHYVVGYGSGADPRPASFDWVEGGVARTRPVRTLVTAGNADLYLDCGVAGLGIIQMPAYGVRELCERGELIPILPDHRPAPMPLSILYPHRRHVTRRARALMDWLEAELRESMLAR